MKDIRDCVKQRIMKSFLISLVFLLGVLPLNIDAYPTNNSEYSLNLRSSTIAGNTSSPDYVLRAVQSQPNLGFDNAGLFQSYLGIFNYSFSPIVIPPSSEPPTGGGGGVFFGGEQDSLFVVEESNFKTIVIVGFSLVLGALLLFVMGKRFVKRTAKKAYAEVKEHDGKRK